MGGAIGIGDGLESAGSEGMGGTDTPPPTSPSRRGTNNPGRLSRRGGIRLSGGSALKLTKRGGP